MIRQGDVLLRKLDRVPFGAMQVRYEAPLVLARGEATGHAHVLEAAGATLFRLAGRLYMVLDTEGTVLHEEHAPVTLEPGTWEVRRQRAYPEGDIVRAGD